MMNPQAALFRRTSLCLCLYMAAQLIPYEALAQSTGHAVANVIAQKVERQVIVKYDLTGPSDAKCSVKLILKRESKPTFNRVLKNVRGDVGAAVTPGRGKWIRWDLAREFPKGFAGDDWYFAVVANPEQESGPAAWRVILLILLFGTGLYLVVNEIDKT